MNFSDQTTRGLPTVETGLEYAHLKAHTEAVERLLGESFVPTQDNSYIEMISKVPVWISLDDLISEMTAQMGEGD